MTIQSFFSFVSGQILPIIFGHNFLLYIEKAEHLGIKLLITHTNFLLQSFAS